MNHSTPGLPVHHQLPEFTQIHIHRVSDAIQPSHPVVPFSSCPQSLPASESFPMSQLFAWGGQSTRVSALASFPPKKSQGWSPSEWTDWIRCSYLLSIQFSSVTQSCPTLCDPTYCSTPGLPVLLEKVKSMELCTSFIFNVYSFYSDKECMMEQKK